MNKFFTNIYPEINLYKKKSPKSEIVTQMIYGERFKIITKNDKWWKIKIKEDGYIGFIKKKIFLINKNPTHKICKLYANFYKYPNMKGKVGRLTYGSKITVEEKVSNFSKFKDGWIKNNFIKPINYKNKDIFFDISIFKNTTYTWGGKSFKGLDCSALVQLFMNFNNKYCPRDTSKQFKYFKKNIKLKNIKKNDIIYWKGHVAVALSQKKLIHAYGPRKKTIIMNIKKTIEIIKKTANLDVIGIKRLP